MSETHEICSDLFSQPLALRLLARDLTRVVFDWHRGSASLYDGSVVVYDGKLASCKVLTNALPLALAVDVTWSHTRCKRVVPSNGVIEVNVALGIYTIRGLLPCKETKANPERTVCRGPDDFCRMTAGDVQAWTTPFSDTRYAMASAFLGITSANHQCVVHTAADDVRLELNFSTQKATLKTFDTDINNYVVWRGRFVLCAPLDINDDLPRLYLRFVWESDAKTVYDACTGLVFRFSGEFALRSLRTPCGVRHNIRLARVLTRRERARNRSFMNVDSARARLSV